VFAGGGGVLVLEEVEPRPFEVGVGEVAAAV